MRKKEYIYSKKSYIRFFGKTIKHVSARQRGLDPDRSFGSKKNLTFIFP